MWGSGSQLKAEIEAHWASDQPDNDFLGVDGGAHCVSLYKLVNSKGALLYDVPCSTSRHSVCEKLAGENVFYQI